MHSNIILRGLIPLLPSNRKKRLKDGFNEYRYAIACSSGILCIILDLIKSINQNCSMYLMHPASYHTLRQFCVPNMDKFRKKHKFKCILNHIPDIKIFKHMKFCSLFNKIQFFNFIICFYRLTD